MTMTLKTMEMKKSRLELPCCRFNLGEGHRCMNAGVVMNSLILGIP